MDNRAFERGIDVVALSEQHAPPVLASNNALPTRPQNPINLEGYATMGVCAFHKDANASDGTQRDPNQPTVHFQDSPLLSSNDAREALARHVDAQCCYGSSPLKDLKFTELKSSNTYHYVLETFTETRKLEYVHQPYLGQVIISNGIPPPKPWEISVQPTAVFSDETKLVEVPNTAQVETCSKCTGLGKKGCSSCTGRGGTNCLSCTGRGFSVQLGQQKQCLICNGSGWKKCTFCKGIGTIVCEFCHGSCRLKWFIQLRVEFKNNRNDFFKKSADISDKLLRNCASKNVFIEQNLKIFPITNYTDQEINRASINLVNSHEDKFNQCRVLIQRHMLNAIPITLCKYKFKEKEYFYYVYGLENKVDLVEYPRTCMCCSIS